MYIALKYSSGSIYIFNQISYILRKSTFCSAVIYVLMHIFKLLIVHSNTIVHICSHFSPLTVALNTYTYLVKPYKIVKIPFILVYKTTPLCVLSDYILSVSVYLSFPSSLPLSLPPFMIFWVLGPDI